MKQHIFVSKLIPPTPVNFYLRRSNLMKKLSGWQHAKCSILHSSAGYGKTSLISQFIKDHQLKCAWYQITNDDDSIFPFFRHFIYSIQQQYPKFGEGLEGWDETLKFHNTEELMKLSKQLANELYLIDQPFVIVLDDYHHVSHVFAINFVMNQLIQFSPNHIHIIVATRKMPDWNSLLQLRMSNQVIECLEAEFVFTNEDVIYLFEELFERSLTQDECELIMQMTEGWAMAVMLLAYKAKYSEEQLLEIAEQSVDNFFSYLSAEVFERLDETFRMQLLQLGVHEEISIDVITDLFGDKWVKEVKPKLSELAFVTELEGGNKFRFHALFRQFLQNRLKQDDPELFEQYHLEAAQYYGAHRLGVLAIFHATKLQNKAYQTELIIQFAPQLIEAGQFEFLLDRIKDFPHEQKPYQLFYYEGECQRYRAQYERAKNAYFECFIKAQMQMDQLFLMRAQFGLAKIYLDTLQPVYAEYHLQQAIHFLSKVEVSDEERNVINSLYTENLINLGRAGEAERWSKENNVNLSIHNIDARLYLRQGKLELAKEVLNERIAKPFNWEEAHRTTDLLLVLIDVFTGEHIQALSRIVSGGKENLVDMPYTLALTKLRKGLALLNIEKQDLVKAKKCFDETIGLLNQLHVNRVKAECYMGFILYYKNNVSEAKRHAQMGLRETNSVQDFWMSALLLTALTKVLAENEQYEEAVDTALQALSYFDKSEDTYGKMVCSFWIAFCYVKLEQLAEAKPYYETYIELALTQYPFFIQKKTLFGPRFVITMFELAKKLNRAEMFQDSLGLRGSPDTELYITLFGPVTIHRKNELIPEKEWKRAKAKELFLYLYLHRDQFVSREQLCEAIWQNDEEAMQRDFKVVYNAMLKALEPTRSAREESQFIIRRQHLYKLEERWIQSDVALFDQYVELGFAEKSAKLSNEWLKLAMQYVQADFCSDILREWNMGIKGMYTEKVLKVLERLAQNYVRLEEFDKVVRWAEKIIALDRGYEEGYRLLILANYYLGNRREAIRQYERCVHALEEEFQIDPMDSTEAVYELVLKM